jgi:hypothetical protein
MSIKCTSRDYRARGVAARRARIAWVLAQYVEDISKVETNSTYGEQDLCFW